MNIYIYIFIYYSCGLFYGTVRILEYIASSEWLISKCWIEQYVKVGGRGLILVSWNFINDCRCHGLHHNRTASKYKSQSLPLKPAARNHCYRLSQLRGTIVGAWSNRTVTIVTACASRAATIVTACASRAVASLPLVPAGR